MFARGSGEETGVHCGKGGRGGRGKLLGGRNTTHPPQPNTTHNILRGEKGELLRVFMPRLRGETCWKTDN